MPGAAAKANYLSTAAKSQPLTFRACTFAGRAVALGHTLGRRAARIPPKKGLMAKTAAANFYLRVTSTNDLELI
ncbi:MAG: hypothetical protein BA864_06870 [Desulfuromonadales bacterium C00003093]|nr:MAG: hypothetical protein BA864_06870 [Desulfuromonadales bacterium C00003093]